jgi:hypothetical protein
MLYFYFYFAIVAVSIVGSPATNVWPLKALNLPLEFAIRQQPTCRCHARLEYIELHLLDVC